MLLFVIQSVVLCLLFTILLAAMFFKQDPVKGIMSYPPAVRKRVAALPQYRDRFAQIKRRNIAAKIISGLAIALLVAVLLWFSGLRSFVDGFLYALGLFMVLNLYDLLILDWLWFCHSKKARIPGTEDMDKEYRGKLFHFIGFLKGSVIGLAVSTAAAGLISLAAMLTSGR